MALTFLTRIQNLIIEPLKSLVVEITRIIWLLIDVSIYHGMCATSFKSNRSIKNGRGFLQRISNCDISSRGDVWKALTACSDRICIKRLQRNILEFFYFFLIEKVVHTLTLCYRFKLFTVIAKTNLCYWRALTIGRTICNSWIEWRKYCFLLWRKIVLPFINCTIKFLRCSENLIILPSQMMARSLHNFPLFIYYI